MDYNYLQEQHDELENNRLGIQNAGQRRCIYYDCL